MWWTIQTADPLKVAVSRRRAYLLKITSIIFIIFLIGCNNKDQQKLEKPVFRTETHFDSTAFLVSQHTIKHRLFLDSIQSFYGKTSGVLDEGRLLYILSLLNLKLGQYDDAREMAGEIFELNIRDSNLLSMSNRLLGLVYSYKGDLGRAEEHFKKAFSLDSISKDTALQIKNLTNLSTVAHGQSNYSEALKYQRSAMELASLTTSAYFVSDFQQELIPIFIELGEFDSAARYLNLCLSAKDSTQFNRFSLLLNYGLLEERLHDYRDALNFYVQALAVAEKTKDTADIALALNNLAYMKFELGNHEEAFVLIDSMNTLEDAARNTDFARTMRDLELRYEDLAKDARLKDLEYQTESDKEFKLWMALVSVLIALIGVSTFLYLRNRLISERKVRKADEKRFEKEKELAAMNSSIATQEQERKRMAMDLHDSLGVLVNIAKLRLSQIRTEVSETDKETLKETMGILDNIRSELRRLAFDLMPPSLSKLGLKVALEELVEKVWDAVEDMEVHFEMNAETTGRDNNFDISMYRTVQELINNGIKHSQARTIDIILSVEKGGIILRYADDGIGFQPNRKNGNGLMSIKSRVEFYGGKLHIVPDEQIGARLYISIPDA